MARYPNKSCTTYPFCDHGYSLLHPQYISPGLVQIVTSKSQSRHTPFWILSFAIVNMTRYPNKSRTTYPFCDHGYGLLHPQYVGPGPVQIGSSPSLQPSPPLLTAEFQPSPNPVAPPINMNNFIGYN